MHISEGVLSLPVLASGTILTIGGTAIGLKKISNKSLPQVALVTAALFVVSVIQIPVGPTSVHLLLTGLAGILLGWQVFPSILVSLLLQAILFQFGGLTTLGINTFNLAAPAVVIYYLLQWLMSLNPRGKLKGLIYFIGGSLALYLSSVLLAVALTLSGENLSEIAKLIVFSYLPVGVIEGIITAIILLFIKKVKPEMLTGMGD